MDSSSFVRSSFVSHFILFIEFSTSSKYLWVLRRVHTWSANLIQMSVHIDFLFCWRRLCSAANIPDMRAAEFTKGSTRILYRAAQRGQIHSFVCDPLKGISHKQATEVDYNRLRPCQPCFCTIVCSVTRWIFGVRLLQSVWRKDTNEGFKVGTPCYNTLLWCDTALISAGNCVLLTRVNKRTHAKGSNRIWRWVR